jgi:hypothetical protein
MPRSSKSHASATGVAKSAAGQARAIAASGKAKRAKKAKKKAVATKAATTNPRQRAAKVLASRGIAHPLARRRAY